MSFHWINAEAFSINTLLLMDRWILNYLVGLSPYGEGQYGKEAYRAHLGVALAYHPTVRWYFEEKCPESRERVKHLAEAAPKGLTEREVRQSELLLLDEIDSFVVYAYPEVMEGLSYIAGWDPRRLTEMTDFTGKTVLDIGSGPGRLACAAAPLAKWVVASEPVDRLREYLREKRARLRVKNLTVVDGTVQEIPYPDDAFDIVMSGYVVGDDLGREVAEMERVTKPDGVVLTCIGEDEHKRRPDPEMLRLGFSHTHYVSRLGGDIYRYLKRVDKA